MPPGVNLYKNNSDGKGASYGTHENYLMARRTPFADIVTHLVPFFVVRQVMCGSGRVGIGVDSRTPGYQIAQRSDFFEVEVGLETTLKRPIINTRDEPHADADRYRRLHVIIGDANHADVANLLKLGTTSLVLAMIEDGYLTTDLTLDNPVATLRAVSHDPTLSTSVRLRDGRSMTAVELLWTYHDLAAAYLEDRHAGEPDPDTAEVMHWWGVVLDKLGRDPMEARREVDWVAKLAILRGYQERDGLDLGGPPAPGGRHPVVRRPCRPGHRRAAPRGRPARAARDRRGGRPGGDDAPRGHPGVVPGHLPAPVPRARSSPRRGTRSSSTCPGRGRCSGSRCSSRCAAPAPRWASSSRTRPDAAALLEGLAAPGRD